MQRSFRPRRAFTLLEMLLAMAIGMLLMAGLYFALDLHLSGTSAGRDQVDQAVVARNVLIKMTSDIKDHLAMLDAYPKPGGTSGTTATATPVVNGQTGAFQFNMGVVGDATTLSLYVSKVPTRQKFTDGLPRGDEKSEDSDLRRITYWLVPNTDGTGGLARQEVKLVTSDEDIDNLPPGIADEQSLVFANQIIALSFQYFDGTAWHDTWDGTYQATEEEPPVGPPVAIEIKITVIRGEQTGVGTDDVSSREFRHVVAIPTASFKNSAQTNGGGGGTP